MERTKEKILLAALSLFAQDGYEAVSMREIAEQLGITKGALYKHYASKQEIFDSIIKRMEEYDVAQAKTFGVPVGTFTQMPEAYRDVTFTEVRAFSLAIFKYWTEDEFVSSFRKMLTIEQYRTPETGERYHQYLAAECVEYIEDLFREMSCLPKGRKNNPRLLAIQYFAPIFMMMSLYDAADDKAAVSRMVKKHIDSFIKSMEESK